MSSKRYGELTPGYELPEFRVIARNIASSGIHDDATASSYGYRGGLVNGHVIYAYLSRGLVGYFGSAWLGSGQVEVRFARPVYEGDEVVGRYTVTEREGDAQEEQVWLSIVAENGEGVSCARGSASLPLADSPEPPEGLPFVEEARRGSQTPVPPIAPGQVALGLPLKPHLVQDSAEDNASYIARVGDPLPIYQRLIHPGCLLNWGAGIDREVRARSDTRALGPQVHVAYAVESYRPALAGRPYTIYGTFVEEYNRKGNDYYTTDSVVCDAEGAYVARVRVTSIYHLAPRG